MINVKKMQENITGFASIDKPWLQYYNNEVINSKLPECTIFDYIYMNNKDYMNRNALNYFGQKITYGQLFENIEKTANALKQNNIGLGGIVTVLMPTLPETIYLLYAMSRIGAIGNMVDPRTSPEGICDYILETESEMLVIVDVVLLKVQHILDKTNVKKVIIVPTGQVNELKYDDTYIRWDKFIVEGFGYTGEIDIPYENKRPIVIVHTGGTTGRPKGVMLTNDNLNAAVFQLQLMNGFNMKREHTWLNIMPPFIAYGAGNALHWPLAVGMEVILIPQFNLNQFDELLLTYKPNHMVGAPAHYGNIIKSSKLKDKDLSFVFAPIVGGDAMNIALEKATNVFLQEHNCAYKVFKGYGMSEVTAGVCVCASNEINKIGSVGIPFSHITIAIFDPVTGKEMKYNQQGEVCITGPNTMLGYYKNQAATDEIIRKHDDGLNWVHSGDIGYMTEDGFLFIADRIKRMIVRYDGFKVFPSLIEKTITKHLAVQACCVVGTPDKNYSQGKLPIAHIVLQSDYAKQAEDVKKELIALCQQELPEYAQPVDFVFRSVIPLTSIGKVDFRALEDEMI